MRQLASIQRIKALEPIENADAIVRATVLGWQLVVKKGEFQVGDLCIYCEIDCLMPNSYSTPAGWSPTMIKFFFLFNL